VPVPKTVDELLGLVRKSGLIDDRQLEGYLHRLRPSARSVEPRLFAAALVRDGVLTHFQAEQFLLGKSRGFSIGNYRVLERIGTGNMALVYLCEHKVMRRRVAVKVLPTQSEKDAAMLKRFYREARAAALLDHPHIVHTYDIDQDDQRHFMVMEFIEGGLLGDIVRRFGPMHVNRAAHYISQAAVGLQFAYESGLIHRDIKPDNLIVDRSGVVKIFDMGLARFYQSSEEVITKGLLGSPDYVSPEQTQDAHSVDIRADIYSLGGTFYYLLTGQTPFGESTVAQKLISHQIRQPRPIRSVRPEVPAELEAVVARMMAKDPAERYQTPNEVVEALAPWTQVPIPPPADEEMPRLSPAVARTAATTMANLALPPIARTPIPGALRTPILDQTENGLKQPKAPVIPPPQGPAPPVLTRAKEVAPPAVTPPAEPALEEPLQRPAARNATATVLKRRQRIRRQFYLMLIVLVVLIMLLVWVNLVQP
jgi:serine/threonine protein kinase